MSTPEIQIKTMALDSLRAADYNPRTISKRAMSGLIKSVSRFGLVQPIVVNKQTGNIVGGHQRVIALRELGEKEALVIEVDLSLQEEQALNLTLNNKQIEGEFTQAINDILLGIDISLIKELSLESLEIAPWEDAIEKVDMTLGSLPRWILVCVRSEVADSMAEKLKGDENIISVQVSYE